MTTQINQFVSNFFVDNIATVRSKSQRLMKTFVDLVSEAETDEIAALVEVSKPMRYSIQACIETTKAENESKEILVQAGYNSALIDAMQLYTNQISIQKQIQNIPTQYKDDLLHILKARGTLLHKDLASELGVSPSELTAIIKKMNSTSKKLINIEPVSKFKLYSLTPIANQYIVKHMPDRAPTHTRVPRMQFEKGTYEGVQVCLPNFDNRSVVQTQMSSYYVMKNRKKAIRRFLNLDKLGIEEDKLYSCYYTKLRIGKKVV